MVMLIIIVLSASVFAFEGKGKTGGKLPVFPVTPKPNKDLKLVDILNRNNSLSQRFALTVLQGLANRDGGKIYILQNPEWHGADNMRFWVENLKKKGYTFEDVSDPFSLFKTYARYYKGAVLYEDNLESTPSSLYKINALTLYCALNDLIPVTPSLNKELNIPVILDTTGKYLTAKTANQWVADEMWAKASKRALAHTNPTHMVLRDYLVMHKILPIWIGDDMSKEEEEQSLRFMDETDPNTPVMGCWGGYGEKPGGRMNEPNLQRLASMRGKFVIVTDGCYDLTVHAGIKFNNPKPNGINNPRKLILDNNKIYICFNISDGDNLQYLQQYFINKNWWGDPNRGRIPLGWTLNPVAAELIPDILEYYIETATDKDGFICFPGIGLITPLLYARDNYSNYENILSDYIKLSAASMKKLGLTSVHFGDTSSVPLTRSDFDLWAKEIPSLNGIFGDYGPMTGLDKDLTVYKVSHGIPVVRAIETSPNNSVRGDNPAKYWADEIRKLSPGTKPGFMHIAVINWYDTPTSIMNTLAELGDDYVPVTQDELFDLVRQSEKK